MSRHVTTPRPMGHRSSPAGAPNQQRGKHSRVAASASDSTSSFSESRTSIPIIGERYLFPCNYCGSSKADATFREEGWRIGSRHADCPGRRDCLAALAEQFDTTPGMLLQDPRAFVAGVSRQARQADARPLPSEPQVDGWAARLLSEPEPLAYLTDRRAIALDVIRETRIGWDGKQLMFPMYRRGGLVAFKTRAPRDKAQMRSWPGRGRDWPLYPRVPEGDEVVLVAGELDALCGLSHGVPAVSVSEGAGCWRERWADDLRGLRVRVCFDNDEARQARDVTDALKAASIDATRLDLRHYGLRTKKGDLSDYLRGRSA